MGIAIAVPPWQVQQLIIDSSDEETTELSRSIEKSVSEIDLIQEFRTRLIADVVTGKLDIRLAARELPEVNEIEVIDDRSVEDDLDEPADDPESEEVAA